MKFSKSLLQDQEIARRIFSNSIEKTKALLKDVFDLDFENKDTKIRELAQDDENNRFIVIFDLNGREITAELNFEPENDDILNETLKIHEFIEEDLILEDLPKNFKKAINKVMDLLEEKYDLNFIMLDPEEKDENIKNIKENTQETSWEVTFTHDDHEAEFKAIFLYREDKGSSLTVKQHRKHVIYLE